MNWINGSTITLVFKINWATVADWVSGIGSLWAIIFAYKQIDQQKKEYDEQRKQYDADKEEKTRQEILANRPFFSFMKFFYLTQYKDHLWLSADSDFRKPEDIFINIDEVLGGNTSTYQFKKGICAYEFKNVSQAIATNLVLKIEYQNETSDEILKTDYCNIRTCVIGNERAIILPHSIMNEQNTYSHCSKSVYLYFSTIDDRVYRQRWIEKIDKSGSVFIDWVDIIEVPKEEMPEEGAGIRLDLN